MDGKFLLVLAFTLAAYMNHFSGGICFRRRGNRRLELVECNGMLTFSIFNQGRPIPADDLPKIWTKFYRDSGAEYSGSGLGLSIVAQILSMQKLPYGAENLADGVRFYFSIPITE